MWNQTDSCANKYLCASAIYIISCLPLIFSIIIIRSVGAHGNGKNVACGLNAIDKRMVKLAIANILNTKIIQDYPIFKFMQVHENKEDQAVSLAK